MSMHNVDRDRAPHPDSFRGCLAVGKNRTCHLHLKSVQVVLWGRDVSASAWTQPRVPLILILVALQ